MIQGHSHTTGGFPVFEGSATYTGAAASSHDVDIPASIQEGDQLVMWLRVSGGAVTMTISGWSQYATVDGDRYQAFSRAADGTEGATQTVSLSASRDLAVVTERWSNADTRAPEATTTGPTTSAAPDGPNHTPTAGALNYAYIAAAGALDGFDATVPTNYGTMIVAERGSGNANVAVAHRTVNAASEDPGAFGLDSSVSWSAMTVSIYPATGGHGATNTISDHIDVDAMTEVRGDLFVVDACTKWDRLAIGASARLLQSDGTDPSWVAMSGDATIAAGGAVTVACTHAGSAHHAQCHTIGSHTDEVEAIEDIAGALIARCTGTHTGITFTYQDATCDLDAVVDHDAASNFVLAEHVDWAGACAGTISTTNYKHNVLDAAAHCDSVADTVTRGSLIIGNATPKWDELVKGCNPACNTTPTALQTQWGGETGKRRKVLVINCCGDVAWENLFSYDIGTPVQVLSFSDGLGDVEIASGGTHTPSFTATYQGTPSAACVNVCAFTGIDPEVCAADYPKTMDACACPAYSSMAAEPAINKETTTVGATVTWKLSATICSSSVSSTHTLTYRNRIYVGPHTNATCTITSAQILTLDVDADGYSELSCDSTQTWPSISTAACEYLWIAYPDRIADFTTVKDVNTGFEIGGDFRCNVSHTNDSGFTETYRTWRSTNAKPICGTHCVQTL